MKAVLAISVKLLIGNIVELLVKCAVSKNLMNELSWVMEPAIIFSHLPGCRNLISSVRVIVKVNCSSNKVSHWRSPYGIESIVSCKSAALVKGGAVLKGAKVASQILNSLSRFITDISSNVNSRSVVSNSCQLLYGDMPRMQQRSVELEI